MRTYELLFLPLSCQPSFGSYTHRVAYENICTLAIETFHVQSITKVYIQSLDIKYCNKKRRQVMATIAPVFAILGASLFNKNTFYSTTITGNSLVYLKENKEKVAF